MTQRQLGDVVFLIFLGLCSICSYILMHYNPEERPCNKTTALVVDRDSSYGSSRLIVEFEVNAVPYRAELAEAPGNKYKVGERVQICYEISEEFGVSARDYKPPRSSDYKFDWVGFIFWPSLFWGIAGIYFVYLKKQATAKKEAIIQKEAERQRKRDEERQRRREERSRR